MKGSKTWARARADRPLPNVQVRTEVPEPRLRTKEVVGLASTEKAGEAL